MPSGPATEEEEEEEEPVRDVHDLLARAKALPDNGALLHLYGDGGDDGDDDDSDDPVKRWIGREVKRFLHEADQHLPFLLSLSSGSIDMSPGTEGGENSDGEEEMDLSGDEFEPTADEVTTEKAQAPLSVDVGAMWDRFLGWVRDIELPWEPEDSDEYRKARALSFCNSARACSRDLA